MSEITIARSDSTPRPGRSGFAENVNPELFSLLQALDLDREFVRGDGIELFDRHGRSYLDFAGAYGALPFGHRPACVWRAIEDVRDSGEAIFVQPAVLTAAGVLADRLGEVAPQGVSRCTFVNSGAEATEVALKIARAATGRLGVLTTANSFHGKTLGALSATGNIKYQLGFGAPAADFDRIPFGDAAAVEAAFVERPDYYAVFLVEPIQGEGGVITPPLGYLTDVRRICDAHGVLLALDEVQTGLGRTGRMFACDHEHVVPDILTLAKALGGGVLPVGAVLCKPDLIGENFALRHTSTFAGNALAARVGVAVVEELTRDDDAVIRSASRTGDLLFSELTRVARKYPSVVREVRGQGLLLGVELTDEVNMVGRQALLGSIAAQENLAIVVTSYLLNVEGIRLAPTLFGNRVLRVEPPLTVTEAQCRTFVAALDRACAFAAAGDLDGLFGHLLSRPTPAAPTLHRSSGRLPDVAVQQGDRRFAFIAHPLNLTILEHFDPSLAGFTKAERSELLRRFAGATSLLNPAPFLIGSGRVIGDGATAHGDLIGIPFTSKDLLTMPRDLAVQAVSAAVDLAVDRGATVIGLGGYSSVVTTNGLDLGVTQPITTGNSFTAAASIRAVRRVVAERELDLGNVQVTVLGAAGAIGRTIAKELAPDVGSIVLVGRPGERGQISPKLWAAAAEIVDSARGGSGGLASAIDEVDGSLDDLLRSGHLGFFEDPAAAVRESLVVVAATSAPHALIDAKDLADGAIVCDVAQPPNIPHDVGVIRPDVTVFDGGIVRLPESSEFGLNYGLAPGLTYACLAETMLIALSGRFDLRSIGTDLRASNVAELGVLSDRHGFTLAEATRWREGTVRVTG